MIWTLKLQQSTSVEFPVIQTIICLHSKWKWKVRGGKRGQEKLTQRLHEIFEQNMFKDHVYRLIIVRKFIYSTFFVEKIDSFFYKKYRYVGLYDKIVKERNVLKIINLYLNRQVQVQPRNKESSKVLSLEGTSLNLKREFVEKSKVRGVKVHIFWEGHKILRYLHLTFDCM